LRPQRSGPPFPLNVIFNVRAFYISFIVVIIASMAAVGLGGVLKPNQPQAQQAREKATPTPQPTFAPQYTTYQRPQMALDLTKSYVAIIHTELGEIRLRLYPDKAPEAVNSFVFLARQGFYNGLIFHIVRPDVGFAQAGDPTCRADGSLACTGAGGPGYTLPQEGNDLTHRRGMVAMAPIGGGGEISGSQFYILLEDMAHMDGRDTLFGQVEAGMEVVESLPTRNPCFQRPSKENPCQEQPPPGVAILEVTIQEG